MKRQQAEELVDVHGHDSMLTALFVHLVVVGDSPIGNIEYPGVSDSHSIGIAPDVFEHLSDSFGRGLGMDNPWIVEALLAYVFGEGNFLLFQPTGQEIHETPTEPVAHSGHGKEKRRTPASMDIVPYTIRINASTGYNAVNVGVVKKVRSPRVEDGCHAGLKPLPGSECINGGPCGLEHTVVELPLVGYCNGMQTVRHGEHDMEVLGRDNLFPAAADPFLAFLVLTLWTVSVPTAVIADMDISTFWTNFDMSTKSTGSALSHVPEGSFDRRNDMMLAQELTAVVSDNLPDVKSGSHLSLGGKMVSISRTCFIGSMLAT